MGTVYPNVLPTTDSFSWHLILLTNNIYQSRTSFTRPLIIVNIFCRISARLAHFCFLNSSHILTSVVERSNCFSFWGGRESCVFLSEVDLCLSAIFFLWVFLAAANINDVIELITHDWILYSLLTLVNSFRKSFIFGLTFFTCSLSLFFSSCEKKITHHFERANSWNEIAYRHRRFTLMLDEYYFFITSIVLFCA